MLLLTLFGFELEGSVWYVDDLPVQYCVGTCPETIPDCVVRVQRAFDRWQEAEPRITSAYLGACVGDVPAEDGVNQITFQGGVPTLITAFGSPCHRRVEADIALADIAYETNEVISAGGCNGGTNFDGTITHEIGHLLGLNDSCEQGETCLEPELVNATMYWSDGPCSTDKVSLADDDLAGIDAVADCAVDSQPTPDTGMPFGDDDDDDDDVTGDTEPEEKQKASSGGCGCSTGTSSFFDAFTLLARRPLRD